MYGTSFDQIYELSQHKILFLKNHPLKYIEVRSHEF